MFFNEEQLATLKNVCQPVVGFFFIQQKQEKRSPFFQPSYTKYINKFFAEKIKKVSRHQSFKKKTMKKQNLLY